MKDKLWKFTDNSGSFSAPGADKIKTLYFPLCNRNLMSSVSPDLHGDIKTSQNAFLLEPVSRINLINLRASRNFWVYIDKDKIWSATGVSKNLVQLKEDSFKLEAGLLWHKITRQNKKIGLKSEILSFAPASGEPLELMQVKLTNISAKTIKFTPICAIPIYARGANSLRDHRHVTSLLQRIIPDKFGVVVKPTLAFDEARHAPNKTLYFVLGWDEKNAPPQYFYPTQEMFCGDAGDLEAPESILQNLLPTKEQIQGKLFGFTQGKETMGALRFKEITLKPKQAHSYIVVMGISDDKAEIKKLKNKFNRLKKVEDSLAATKNFWLAKTESTSLATGSPLFDNWFCWVSIQPALRKIFGCSFLPDFDYGKGGRGWRDLWQDCLGLILNNPSLVRGLLINNFSGVRADGSNATIIGKEPGEFIADRNNISRVWMDHGVWPLLTLDLYLHESGDFGILFEKTGYFSNQRGKTHAQGTILEHLLVQNLRQFFNVGAHNHTRLEGADWNDGLDMAKDKGESVAFSALYAHNLLLLAEILLKINQDNIDIAQELKILLRKINYNDIKAKQGLFGEYVTNLESGFSGNKVKISTAALAEDLKEKSAWMMQHIRKNEWLAGVGFFNGYYDNLARRVEGVKNNLVKMSLTSQVFPIMSGTASDTQARAAYKSARKYLFNQKIGGFHLNTDFKEEQYHLGRAFSFIYGDKENGAFFSHMSVMFAFALYKRGLAQEGWQVLSSLYNMAINTEASKIYPCLPEYFNLKGQGMYSYLTGSASWFVLTLLTQSFGVRGKDGDLLIEPKLTREQFKDSLTLNLNRVFAGRKLKITFSNSRRLEYGRYKIIKASLNARDLAPDKSSRILISRKTILGLSQGKANTLNITLG